MNDRCQSYKGCDERDCPIAVWCKLSPDHDGDHDYETAAERRVRTGL